MRILTVTLLLLQLGLNGQIRGVTKIRPFFIDQDLFVHDSLGYHGNLQLDTIYYDDKTIRAIGTRAVDKYGHKSLFKIGKWTEFYEDGQLKSLGSYELQDICVCSSAQAAIVYRSYKLGEWSYFYPNGVLKAKGIYKIEKQEANTGIAGQYLYVPIFTDSWTFRDEKGEPTIRTETITRELTINEF